MAKNVVSFKGRRVVRIEGLEEVRKVFRDLSPMAIGRITNALNTGAAEIQALARTLVPQSTGELRDAIEIRDNLEGFNATGIVGALSVGTGSDAARGVQRFIGVYPAKRGSPGWYGAFVEFGTSPRVKGQKFTQASGRRTKVARDTHPGTAARPFLFPAYNFLRRRVRARIARELNAGIRALAKLRRAA
jgi:HK97 gp10 family phage protein